MVKNTLARIQIIAVLIGILLLIIKFSAWLLTNSNALLSDALESIINVVAGCFALFSLYVVAKPKDRNHPYGHGKIEFIAAGLEGGLIFVAGVLIIGKGIFNLFLPQPLTHLSIGIFVTLFSGLINFLLGYFLEAKGNKHNSLVLIADGKHLRADAYSSLGVLVGLLLTTWTGLSWIDNVTAIIFGAIILFTGYKLLRTALSGIMDEADENLIESLVKILDKNKSANWIDVHNFRVIKYGAAIHIDCHITIPHYFDVVKAHDEVKNFENLIAKNCEMPVELFIHVDPCEPPDACKICRKKDCPVRKIAQSIDVIWTLDNLMTNRKHHH